MFLRMAEPMGFILLALVGPRYLWQCLSPQQYRWTGKNEGIIYSSAIRSSWSSRTVCAWIMATRDVVFGWELLRAHCSAWIMLSEALSPLQWTWMSILELRRVLKSSLRRVGAGKLSFPHTSVAQDREVSQTQLERSSWYLLSGTKQGSLRSPVQPWIEPSSQNLPPRGVKRWLLQLAMISQKTVRLGEVMRQQPLTSRGKASPIFKQTDGSNLLSTRSCAVVTPLLKYSLAVLITCQGVSLAKVNPNLPQRGKMACSLHTPVTVPFSKVSSSPPQGAEDAL